MGEFKENLLVFGATGYIGAYILKEILKNKDSFGRIAIITSPSTVENKSEQLQNLKSEGVEVIVGDVTNPADVLNAFKGINTVISTVGRNVLAEQINWIQLAEKAPSVRRFFPSEYGTDIDYSPQSVHEIPHQLKIKVRAALKATTSLDYTYVVTGPYADGQMLAYLSPLAESARVIGTYDVKAKSATLIEDGKGKISLTTPKELRANGYSVGKLVVKALLHPEASKKRALKVNSFTTTPAEIVAEFEKQTGEKWNVTYTSLSELKELEAAAWENKVPMAPLYTLRRIWAEGGTLYAKRDNSLLDAEDNLETLADAVRDAILTQRSETQATDTRRLS
ncbi:Isoflavone reductase-like protein [Lachnellula hyalina]|uniref:Isoflavone reductase-like protein n=1 Tax=Lachnellula hyalina TaxID=1316788 RepID=A0A8H8RAP5_9HELO|nr:Isoflavone reductase-like protein [Lachnellula hyalina]TVY30692.1 Isoflavone reductase-like protein [Lachnellula hyalina]